MCVKIPLVSKARVRGKHRYITLWIGPFQDEATQISWQSGFESALELHEFKNYEIKAIPSGENYPEMSSADISPNDSPEIAVLKVPRLLLEQMNKVSI
jgi:hypothetical protein